MTWNLKNVALEPAYAGKRRTASKMDMEPVIAGVRIRLRQQITISDEMYETNKVRIAICIKHGVLTAVSSEPDTKPAMKAAPPKVAATPDPVETPTPEPEPAPELPPAPTPAPPKAEEKAPAPSRKSSKKSSKKGSK